MNRTSTPTVTERTPLINDYADHDIHPKANQSSSYLASSLIFLLSSIVALGQAGRDMFNDSNTSNLLTFIVSALYCLGYGAYTLECWRDARNTNQTKGALPMYAMPHVMRALH